MTKAVFLDRDGVINKERGEYTFKISDFQFIRGVEDVLKEFQKRGYVLIIITNQSGIAKGKYTHHDFLKVTDYMVSYLAEKQVKITAVYYCPHHDEVGKCLCRKPDSLLIEKAIARYAIDPASSFLIGDRERDIAAAEKTGVNGIKINSNISMKSLLNFIH